MFFEALYCTVEKWYAVQEYDATMLHQGTKAGIKNILKYCIRCPVRWMQ